MSDRPILQSEGLIISDQHSKTDPLAPPAPLASGDSETQPIVDEKPWLFKKGEIHSPGGRGRGVKSKTSIYRDMLQAYVKFEDPTTGVNIYRTAIEHVIASQIHQAMMGNTTAQAAVLDRYLGKVENKVTLAGDENNPLEIISRIVHNIIDPQDSPPPELIQEAEVTIE